MGTYYIYVCCDSEGRVVAQFRRYDKAGVKDV